MIVIEATGPRALFQDAGRLGWAHLGVGHSGAYDSDALHRANALVGNLPGAAAVETTLGGFRFRPTSDVVVAVTGATCRFPTDVATLVGADEIVALGSVSAGVRNYVAFAGGIVGTSRGDVAVLGSWSTDTLNGLGPPALTAGMTLTIGDRRGTARATEPTRRPNLIRLLPGPRADWADDPIGALTGGAWTVDPRSDRVALRLAGPPIRRRRNDELVSEPLIRGAVQLPAGGQPLIFGPDCPTTGGYPVVAVVHPDDVAALAQYRPGQPVRFVV